MPAKGSKQPRDEAYVQSLILRNAVWKDLYSSGLTFQEIGEKYGVNQATVYRSISNKLALTKQEPIPDTIHRLRLAIDNSRIDKTIYPADLVLMEMKEGDAKALLSPELMEYRKRLLE